MSEMNAEEAASWGQACDEAFSGDWSDGDDAASVSFDGED